MNDNMKTLTLINSVGMALFGAAMFEEFGEFGIAAVAYMSSLANALVLLMEGKEEKKTV